MMLVTLPRHRCDRSNTGLPVFRRCTHYPAALPATITPLGIKDIFVCNKVRIAVVLNANAPPM